MFLGKMVRLTLKIMNARWAIGKEQRLMRFQVARRETVSKGPEILALRDFGFSRATMGPCKNKLGDYGAGGLAAGEARATRIPCQCLTTKTASDLRETAGIRQPFSNFP
jgi:hypothetical protein